ncbi:MAG TPA: 2-dehydropantoate 2-reductase [Vicinamibacteria bacterium]|nr:2-dehydropantoate 2-reductase [Vicinamibacteria bacterium]
MKIAVYGAGGVGGYFGARLAEAGHDVAFLARGTHLEALKRNGLELNSPEGDVRVSPVVATDDPAALPPVDVVLLGVKAFQVRAVASTLGPLLGPETFVLPLQNGVDAAAELGETIGAKRVVPGLCRISSFVEAPGRIRHVAIAPTIEFGESDGRRSPRVEALAAAFGKARGLTATIVPNIEAAIWEKFLFISPASGVAGAARRPIGEVRTVPESRALLKGALEETLAVARARGIRWSDDMVAKTFAVLDALPATAVPSMARDIALGKPSELEYQTGAVVRQGRERSVPVTVNAFLYACLLPAEREARRLANLA